MSAKTCRNLILILGDQLSADISSLRQADPEVDAILIAEVMA
jgi:deoxyribodipyrimidine photolyase-related protein